MYKVIKDDKIIGISEDKPILLDEYEVIEDAEHTVDEYEQYNGEYLLKSDIPAPTREEISALREQAYIKEVDVLHAQKDRKTILGTWTEEDEANYIAEVKRRSEDIANRYPYPTEE